MQKEGIVFGIKLIRVETSRVYRKQKNGDIYVYKRKTFYGPERKYNRVLKSKLVGKIQASSQVSMPMYTRQGGMGQMQNGVRPGMMDVIDYFGRTSGIDEDLYGIAGRGRWEDAAQMPLAMARYFLATDGQDLSGMRYWQYAHGMPYKDATPEIEFCQAVMGEYCRWFQEVFSYKRCCRMEASCVTVYLLELASDGQMRWAGTYGDIASLCHAQEAVIWCIVRMSQDSRLHAGPVLAADILVKAG